MNIPDNVLGIDYGSKLAGTTAIAYYDRECIRIVQSEKKKDADQFISAFVQDRMPGVVFIDAPLSLPAAYFGKGDDYFYRACDRTLKAMSPMFLGGLTARAMKLQQNFKLTGPTFYETYPGHLAQILELPDLGYKKGSSQLAPIRSALQMHFNMKVPDLSSWHQVDALLALLSATRHAMQQHVTFGNEEEGLIYV